MTEQLSAKLIRLYLCCLLFIAAAYVLGASYLGTNGNHAWRQADVYSHILGFQGQSGLSPFENFFGERTSFDFPVYSMLIAKLSESFDSDSLVIVRQFNFIALLVTAYAGYEVASRFFNRNAGTVFLSLIATSRLVLHYFSVPLPDVLAIALAVLGFRCLLLGTSSLIAAAAITSLAAAALIKSPVAFPFVVSLLLLAAVTRSQRDCLPIGFHRRVLVMAVFALIAALFAEWWRLSFIGGEINYEVGAAWYFGGVDLRISEQFRAVLWARLSSWGPSAFPYVALGACLLLFTPVLASLQKNLVASLIAAFAASWLVFSNLYFVHDYYQLPVVILLALAVAGAVSPLLARFAAITPYSRVLLALVAIWFLAAQTSLLIFENFSERTRLSPFAAIEMLVPQGQMVLVAEDGGRTDPSIGGRFARQIVRIEKNQLESDCEKLIPTFAAIVAIGPSPCLNQHRQLGVSFFRSGSVSALVRKTN
jgi:hypothetical protein